MAPAKPSVILFCWMLWGTAVSLGPVHQPVLVWEMLAKVSDQSTCEAQQTPLTDAGEVLRLTVKPVPGLQEHTVARQFACLPCGTKPENPLH